MTNITKEDIAKMIREAYDKRIKIVELDLKHATSDNPKGVPIIGKELRLRHKKSGLIYTVTGVGHTQHELTTPDGDKFVVGSNELEDEYELD